MLRVATFNMHVFNTGKNYFAKLLQEHDVIVLQEHMLRDVDLNLLSSICIEHNYYLVPAEHDGGVGRPFGGLGIFVRCSLKVKKDLLGCENKRVNGVLLNIGGMQVAVFNVYLLCNDISIEYDTEVQMCFQFIQATLLQLGLDNVCYVIGGDFNRNINDMLVNNDDSILCKNLNELCLHSALAVYDGPMKYTYVAEANNRHSWLDDILFFCGPNMSLYKVDVSDDEENFSDHVAVSCVFLIKNVDVITAVEDVEQYAYIWSCENKGKYFDATCQTLQAALVQFRNSSLCKCSDSECKNDDHLREINVFYDNIVNSLQISSRQMYVKKRVNNIVAWSPRLSCLKNESRRAVRVWHLAGCPLHGVLWEKKKTTKKAYREGLHQVRHGNEVMRFNTLRNAMNNSDKRKFWSIWNSKNVHKTNNSSHTADDFAKHFGENFTDKSANEKLNIDVFIKSLVSDYDNVDADEFNVERVEKALRELNLSNALDCDRLGVLHLLYAHPAVVTCLSILYKSIIVHGFVPDHFGLSAVIPTVKSNIKSVNDITNFRPISIMPIISKVFEKCVANILNEYFVFNDNQFGFVRNGGCGKALFAFKNIVNYFNERGSKVLCCSLDLTKAFDRINHYALLKAMHQKGMPVYMIKLFADWWGKMKDVVMWRGKSSMSFLVGSGVPQGSLLGGKFFNLMMDSVLEMLKLNDLGCHVGGEFAGALAYADDLILLSPSVICMQEMLTKCSEKLGTMGLKFNVAKCIAIMFGKCVLKSPCKLLVLYNELLPWSLQVNYLGIEFKSGEGIGVELSPRSHKFTGSVASVLRGRVLHNDDIYVNVINSKCMPILFYGLDVLYMNERDKSRMSVVWNTAFRWILGLSRSVSMRGYLRDCGTMSFNFLLDKRFLLFLCSLKDNCTALLSRLLTVIHCSKVFTSILSKYSVWCVSGASDVRHVVANAFERHCIDGLQHE
jgi:hypothetical protein